MHRRVDPAALLIAVLTVGVDPLTTTGPWEKINTIVAVVVGVVLAAFTWPRTAGVQDESGQMAQVDNWVIAAQAIVYGLIIAIGVGWPVQLLLNPPDCPAHLPNLIPPACAEADRISDVATYWALGIGALAAVILFFLLRKAVMRLSLDPPQEPESPGR